MGVNDLILQSLWALVKVCESTDLVSPKRDIESIHLGLESTKVSYRANNLKYSLVCSRGQTKSSAATYLKTSLVQVNVTLSCHVVYDVTVSQGIHV